MTLVVTHAKVSAIPDVGNPALVEPSDWNANHVVTGFSGPTVYTSDTTFYVATTGNDSTGDGSVGNPWKTIQFGVDFLSYDTIAKNCNLTLQVEDGTYAENVVLGPNSGVSSASENPYANYIVQGHDLDASKVIIAPTTKAPNFATVAVFNGTWLFKNFTIKTQTAGNEGILVHDRGNLFVGALIFADNMVGAVFDVAYNSFVLSGVTFPYTDIVLNGTAEQFVSALDKSVVDLDAVNLTFNVDPLFTLGVWACQAGSGIVVEYSSFSGTPVASPGKSNILTNSWVNDSAAIASGIGIAANSTITLDATSSYNGVYGAISKAGLPVATDLPPSGSAVFKDTSGGGVYLCYNDAGTLKKVALT